MVLFANIALTFAIAITFLKFVLADKVRMARGYERIGADIVTYVFAAVRWMTVLAAIIACAALGRFDWIWPSALSAAGHGFLAIIVHAGLGLLVVFCLMAYYDRHYASIQQRMNLTLAFAGCVIVPIGVIVLLLVIANSQHAAISMPVRIIECVAAALAIIGFACGAIMQIAEMRVRAARCADAAERERQERERLDAMNRELRSKQDAELDALDRDAPFEAWIEHNHIQYSDAHQARAIEIISQRPNLVAELSEMLQRDDRVKREWANALTARIKPRPPQDVAPALIVAMRKHAQQMAIDLSEHEREEGGRERENGEIQPLSIYGWRGFCQSILDTAKSMPDPSPFREPLREVMELVDRFENDEDQRALLAQYRAFLGESPVKC